MTRLRGGWIRARPSRDSGVTALVSPTLHFRRQTTNCPFCRILKNELTGDFE
jgi:hypothetical protein